MVEVSEFLKYFYWCFKQKQVSAIPARDKLFCLGLRKSLLVMLFFTCGMIELLMVCFVFVSVDHSECEACYLEAVEQDNYHQGKPF